jgi:uncharacterized protein (UPF0276 family)
MQDWSKVPTLGVGLGFREPLRQGVFHRRDGIDFLEITADHYMDAPREKRDELDLLRRNFTLIPHGLRLSLGSAEGIDPDYLAKLAEIVEIVRPPYWSEHVACTRGGGVEIGHLAPLPWTDEVLDVLTRNIETAQRRIPVPLIVENITYVVNLGGQGEAEAEFLGLLLDVTNVHTNAVNHGFDADAFLDRLPADRVVQLHFVGGHWQDGWLVDSHVHPTPPEVWTLLDQVLKRFPVKGVILERDGNYPPFEELDRELARARSIGRTYGRWA